MRQKVLIIILSLFPILVLPKNSLAELTKEDIGEIRTIIREELQVVRGETQKEFQAVRTETQKEFQAVRIEMRKEFQIIRVEMQELEKRLNQRMDQTEKRLDQRIDNVTNLQYVILAGIFALVGFVLWDRRTALAPAIKKNKELEDKEEKIEKALKEYARKNPDLAEILKGVGLL